MQEYFRITYSYCHLWCLLKKYYGIFLHPVLVFRKRWEEDFIDWGTAFCRFSLKIYFIQNTKRAVITGKYTFTSERRNHAPLQATTPPRRKVKSESKVKQLTAYFIVRLFFASRARLERHVLSSLRSMRAIAAIAKLFWMVDNIILAVNMYI